LRAAIAAVNEGGEVIVVDIATRDEPTMDGCVKVFQWYQMNGNGEVHDEIVETEEDLHNVLEDQTQWGERLCFRIL
jgi:hypothetical protein